MKRTFFRSAEALLPRMNAGAPTWYRPGASLTEQTGRTTLQKCSAGSKKPGLSGERRACYSFVVKWAVVRCRQGRRRYRFRLFSASWDICLTEVADSKRLVGASGFEPPTSWSRTRRSSQAEPRPESEAGLTVELALGDLWTCCNFRTKIQDR